MLCLACRTRDPGHRGFHALGMEATLGPFIQNEWPPLGPGPPPGRQAAHGRRRGLRGQAEHPCGAFLRQGIGAAPQSAGALLKVPSGTLGAPLGLLRAPWAPLSCIVDWLVPGGPLPCHVSQLMIHQLMAQLAVFQMLRFQPMFQQLMGLGGGGPLPRLRGSFSGSGPSFWARQLCS